MVTNGIRRKLRIALLEGDHDYAWLGRETGYTQGYLRLVICGAKKSAVAREKIENLLGVPLWSDPLDFQTRQSAKASPQAAFVENNNQPKP